MIGPVFRLGQTSSGGGGNVTTSGMNVNTIPAAASATDIENGLMSQDHVGPGATAVINSGTFIAGSSTPANPKAILQAKSTTKGFQPPQMTNAQRLAIGADGLTDGGLIVYCLDTPENLFYFFKQGAVGQWAAIISAVGSGLTSGAIPVADTNSLVSDSPITVGAGPTTIVMGSTGIETIFPAHISTTGSAPAITLGAGAGTGATSSINGNDICGSVTIAYGTGPVINSNIFTLTFVNAYAVAPKAVIVTMGTIFGGTVQGIPYVDAPTVSSALFHVKSGIDVSGITGTHTFFYWVIS